MLPEELRATTVPFVPSTRMLPECAVVRTSPETLRISVRPEEVSAVTPPSMPSMRIPPEVVYAWIRVVRGVSISKRMVIPLNKAGFFTYPMRMRLPFCSIGGFCSMPRMFSSETPRSKMPRTGLIMACTRTEDAEPVLTRMPPGSLLISRSTRPETAKVLSNVRVSDASATKVPVSKRMSVLSSDPRIPLDMGAGLTQAEKGRTFRALHARDGVFVIPNPWDVGTARLLAHLGFEALATTSAGYAFSVGQRDNTISRDAMMEHVAAIATATDLPVSGDLENGFRDVS